MKSLIRTSLQIAVVLAIAVSIQAQQAKRTPFDVTNYVITADLSPIDNKITATTDVTFIPGETTRSVAFELNGSLKVDDVSRVGAGTPIASAPKSKTAKPVTTSAAPV